jgi:cellulase/cellobiase CelA1
MFIRRYGMRTLAWRLGVVVLPLVSVACSSAGSAVEDEAAAHADSALSCPEGSLRGPAGSGCAELRDRRAEFSASARKNVLPPNLRQQRAKRSAASARRTSEASTAPVPGGLGAGVAFKAGSLRAANSATLYTKMIVYPDGLGNLPDWLYTTSTNRTEKTVEVVGGYLTADTHWIGVFDWSCAEDAPCEGGQTSPSWIWVQQFRDEPCHFAQRPDASGVMHDTMYYANTTTSSGGTWSNRVSFWNYCSSAWDLVYSHDFGGTERDCSLDNSCGWWGPIIENFFPLDGPTSLPELGFSETTLVHDGATSLLPEAETTWSAPPSNWNLCYRVPNTSWATTNQACPESVTPTLRVTAQWEGGYCADVSVTNAFTSAVTSWAVTLQMNQSTMNNNWSANFQLASAGLYRVTPVFWNSNIAPGQSVSFGFCANKTGANWNPSVSPG